VHNLARNAAQAMPGGGTFTVATRVEGEALVFEFADTGSGIPEEMEGRLFELFATTGKKDGTGLGLAIVKKIVDEHQVLITYASSRGEGVVTWTTLRIALPMENPAAADDGSTAVRGPAAAGLTADVPPAADADDAIGAGAAKVPTTTGPLACTGDGALFLTMSM
jgi:hypothetical protein